MPPNILIVLGIAVIFALFLSDNNTKEDDTKNDARMVSHGRNRVSGGINSGLGKRRTKRNGPSLKVSHFIEDDDNNIEESTINNEYQKQTDEKEKTEEKVNA